MTNKSKKTSQTSKAQPTEDKTKSRIAHAKQKKDQGAPVERYRGEPTGKHVGDPGDLDEETLDRDAPYNRTYGREDK